LPSSGGPLGDRPVRVSDTGIASEQELADDSWPSPASATVRTRRDVPAHYRVYSPPK